MIQLKVYALRCRSHILAKKGHLNDDIIISLMHINYLLFYYLIYLYILKNNDLKSPHYIKCHDNVIYL